MAQAKLKVILLRATPDPDELVALGARLCYARADLDALQQKVESGDQRGFVERVMQRGHLSVTEHASFTFAVEGVSRALLAQLLRQLRQTGRFLCRASAMSPWPTALTT